MSSYLTLNGLTLTPSYNKGMARSDLTIGPGIQRAQSGEASRNLRGYKQQFGSENVLDTQGNSDSFGHFLRGEWDHWSFLTGLGSDLGVQPYASSGASQTATGGPFAPGIMTLAITTGSIEWINVTANNSTATWSFMGWQYTSSWAHWVVIVSAGVCIQVLKNGVTQAATLPSWIASDATNLGIVLSNTTGSLVSYNDIVILPFALPTSWGAQFYAWMNGNAWTTAPQLMTSGDFGNLLVKGDADTAALMQAGLGGTWNTAAEKLGIQLKGI